MGDQENKIDVFGPQVILAFVAAFIGDFTFFFVITHYLCGAIVIGAFWHKSKGLLAKTVLVLAFLIPLPTLSVGIFLAIILSNKALAFIAEQVGVIALAIATGGAGVAAEGAVAAGETAEGAAVIAESVEAGEIAASTTEAAEVAGESVSGVGTEITEEAGASSAEGSATEEAAEEIPKGDSRPSEKTTERDSPREKIREKIKERLKKKAEEGVESDEDEDEDKDEGASEEELRRLEREQDYETMMESEAEKSPIEETEEQLFSEKGPPVQDIKKPARLRIPDPRENNKTSRLSDAFARAQKAREQKRELEELKRPNLDEDITKAA